MAGKQSAGRGVGGGGVAREIDLRGAGLQQIGDRHDITTDAERA